MNQNLKPARLGRGLSALLGEYAGARSVVDAEQGSAPVATSEEDLAASEIAIERIAPNPKQPRRTFGETELAELAESIRTRGVLQAILVRPDPSRPEMFEIVAGSVAGERRAGPACRSSLLWFAPLTIATCLKSPSSKTCSAPISIRLKKRTPISR